MNRMIVCIAEYMNIKAEEITMESHLVRDLGLTSFDMVELSCEFEDMLGREVSTQEMAGIEYVKDLERLLN